MLHYRNSTNSGRENGAGSTRIPDTGADGIRNRATLAARAAPDSLQKIRKVLLALMALLAHFSLAAPDAPRKIRRHLSRFSRFSRTSFPGQHRDRAPNRSLHRALDR
jgi:hypothetical protein